MELQLGMIPKFSNQACKIINSLYGLKQTSRKWHEKFLTTLTKVGFVQGSSNLSLFIKHKDQSFTTLTIYVDYVILAQNDLSAFQHIKDILQKFFGIKDIGKLKYFLGIEVTHSNKGISICQRKYCTNLLTDTRMLGCKPVNTPMDYNLRLLYLTTTRPYITYSVQQLSQFMARPIQTHQSVAIRIPKYLKKALGQGLVFPISTTVEWI